MTLNSSKTFTIRYDTNSKCVVKNKTRIYDNTKGIKVVYNIYGVVISASEPTMVGAKVKTTIKAHALQPNVENVVPESAAVTNIIYPVVGFTDPTFYNGFSYTSGVSDTPIGLRGISPTLHYSSDSNAKPTTGFVDIRNSKVIINMN